MDDLFKRFGLLICVGLYTAGLVVLHALGQFPAAGLYDVSRLLGAPSTALEGRVIHFPSTRWNQTRFLLEGHADPQDAFRGRVVVQLHFPVEDLAPQEHVRARGWLMYPKAPTLNRPFDERVYWAGFRAYAILHVWSPEGLERLDIGYPASWAQQAWFFHQRFKQYWFDRLPSDEAALLSSITLGSRGILPTDIKQQCIRAGVYHILVVSGQKMALMIALGIGLLRMLRVPRRWAIWLCCPPIVFYAFAVGADPPVVRAATMAIIGLGVFALGRDVPTYYPFVLAWFWILLWEPESLFGASFQLSFGATASLLAVFPLFRTRWQFHRAWTRWLAEAGAVSIAVNLGVWPLLIYYFHQISLAGFIANWTLFPLSGFIMVAGLLMGTWGILYPESLPNILIDGMHQALRGSLLAIEHMSKWKWAAFQCSAPPGWVIGVYYSLLICILFKLAHGKKSSAL